MGRGFDWRDCVVRPMIFFRVFSCFSWLKNFQHRFDNRKLQVSLSNKESVSLFLKTLSLEFL